MTGEGKCAKCTGTDPYFASEKKCGSATCVLGSEFYLTGEYKCASCAQGEFFLTSKKECLTSTCSSNYTYVGEGKCEGCPTGETYLSSEKKCAKCASSDTYAGESKCEYQNTSSGCDTENTEPLEPTIDAAILSTAHSFIVNNFKCGTHIGFLNVWGSIAQFWRGPVGTGGGGGSGYTKNYNYDDRLQTLQPPDFLAPTSSSLKLSRLTEVKNGYTG